MPPLEDLSIGHRVAVTAAIAITILLLLALIGWLSGRWDQAQGQAYTEFVIPERFHADIIELDKRALDDAYVLQAQHLFRTWITDRLHDPSGIDRGLLNSRKGYVIARERLEKREGKP